MGKHFHLNPKALRRDETQRVTVVGALINFFLSVFKLIGGILGQSQALIADGIHSLSDLASDALIWWAAQHASEAPDAEHPYGHGRFETAATLGLGAILVLIAGGIMIDAIERLLESERLFRPERFALYIAAVSVLIKEGMYWYTVRVARQIRSEMLKANAWHHRSDAISSVVVLVGVGGTLLGYPGLDAAAAVVVGIMVAKVGWDLGWGALQELVDASLEESTVKQIRSVIDRVPGVRSLHMLRTRRQGYEACADVHVLVHPWVSVSEGHMISNAVEQRIMDEIDEITDVTVHIDPEDDEAAPPCEGLPLRDEALAELRAAWHELDCLNQHRRILLHYLAGRIDVEVFFPLSCYRDAPTAASLKAALNQSATALGHYRRVEVYYG